MNPYTVIIPSCTLGNVFNSAGTVEDQQPNAPIIIVANGKLLGDTDTLMWDWCVLEWREPFNFSAVLNFAVSETEPDDDLLFLNDDTRLLTPGGFDLLRQAAYEHPNVGIMGASVTGCTGNPDQIHRPGAGVQLIKQRCLPFIAVYIRRGVWDQVGPMDERFTGYGFEDDDYCTRVRQAGFDVAVCHDCVIEHGELPSSYRSGKNYTPAMRAARAIYEDKWGPIGA